MVLLSFRGLPLFPLRSGGQSIFDSIPFGCRYFIAFTHIFIVSFSTFYATFIFKTSPSRVLADKIYRNRDNLRYCKERGIRLSGPALGRPKKGDIRDEVQDYKDESERVEVERRFSLAKQKCGMGLVTARLQETAEHVIAMSILLLNLRRATAALFPLFCWLVGLATSLGFRKEKWILIQ